MAYERDVVVLDDFLAELEKLLRIELFDFSAFLINLDE